jgi:hypothetical protein
MTLGTGSSAAAANPCDCASTHPAMPGHRQKNKIHSVVTQSAGSTSGSVPGEYRNVRGLLRTGGGVRHGSTATGPDPGGSECTLQDADQHRYTSVDVVPADGMQEVRSSSLRSSTSRYIRWSEAYPWPRYRLGPLFRHWAGPDPGCVQIGISAAQRLLRIPGVALARWQEVRDQVGVFSQVSGMVFGLVTNLVTVRPGRRALSCRLVLL